MSQQTFIVFNLSQNEVLTIHSYPFGRYSIPPGEWMELPQSLGVAIASHTKSIVHYKEDGVYREIQTPNYIVEENGNIHTFYNLYDAERAARDAEKYDPEPFYNKYSNKRVQRHAQDTNYDDVLDVYYKIPDEIYLQLRQRFLNKVRDLIR